VKALWAPWRSGYVMGPREEGCFLCAAPAAGDDRGRRIVHRSRRVYVILNSFPYNSGHVMVAPLRHVARPQDLDEEERLDLMDTLVLVMQALQAALQPEGFNVGLNLGRAAGAGVEQHLHLHVVPRWVGDTNFMPVLADTKVLPEHLDVTYEKLRQALHAVQADASGGAPTPHPRPEDSL
ncbi:MAG: HIT domain-containing protein, partial [Armatimonadota bacterium]|nr:HIT domain-containing protein [Armatimonadota bacterium]